MNLKQQPQETGEVRQRGLPHDVRAHSRVVVDDEIAHGRRLPPRNQRVRTLESVRDFRGGLTDYLEQPFQSQLFLPMRQNRPATRRQGVRSSDRPRSCVQRSTRPDRPSYSDHLPSNAPPKRIFLQRLRRDDVNGASQESLQFHLQVCQTEERGPWRKVNQEVDVARRRLLPPRTRTEEANRPPAMASCQPSHLFASLPYLVYHAYQADYTKNPAATSRCLFHASRFNPQPNPPTSRPCP